MDQIDVKNAGDVLVEDGKPVIAHLLIVGGQAIHVQLAEGVVWRRRRRLVLDNGATVVGGGMVGHLRRLARAGIGHRRIDLGRRWATRRRASYASTLGAGRGRALRRLRREAARGRALGRILLAKRRLLRRRRRRRRRPSKSGRRRLRHLMLRWLLVLRRRWWWRRQRLARLTRHYSTEDVAPKPNVGRLRRASMLRRAIHSTLRRAAPGVELRPEMVDLFLIPAEE